MSEGRDLSLTREQIIGLRIAEQVIGRNRLLPKAQFIVQEMFPEDPTEPSRP